jgi:hypothetical protein
MAKAKIITDKLTLDVVNAKRSAAGLMTEQKLLKDNLEKKTKKLAHEIDENGKLGGSKSAQSQTVGDLTSDKKQLTSKLKEANLQLEIYKQHSTTFYDDDGKEITSNAVINKADMLSLEPFWFWFWFSGTASYLDFGRPLDPPHHTHTHFAGGLRGEGTAA